MSKIHVPLTFRSKLTFSVKKGESMKFSKTNLATTIAKLKIPKGKRDAQIFDDKLPGFGLRKFKSGAATFFVKYNVGKQQRRMSLGVATANRLEGARADAERILAKAKLGDDPQAVKRAQRAKTATALGGLVDRYLEARQDDVSATYFVDTTRYLTEVWKPLHGYAVDAVTRRDVVNVLDTVAKERGKPTADHAKAALSTFYAWLIERGYCDTSPLLHIKARGNGGGRDRVLSETEVASVWRASRNLGDYGTIVRLLILTGQRKSEIADLEWSEIDFAKEQLELPAARTKNSRAHVVPLGTRALAALAGVAERAGRDFVFGEGSRGFQGWSKSKGVLGSKLPADMPAWTLHDLRRSVVTHINENGIAEPHVIEAVLNHVSGHRAGVAGVYNRAAYSTEKRAALQAWGEHVSALVAR